MNGGSEVDENIIESVEEDVNINNKNNATNFMKIFQKIISAALGGLTVSLLVTPLDVVKARLQSQINIETATLQNKQFYTGTIDAILKIARNEGIHALWRGLYPSLVLTVPSTVLYFGIYDNFKDYLLMKYPNSPLWFGPVVSGIVARVASVTMSSPLDLMRTNMQANTKLSADFKDNRIIYMFREIGRKYGYKQLWRGLAPTVLRDVPFSVVYWTGYEYSRKFIFSYDVSTSQFTLGKKLYVDFGSGVIGGVLASLISNPADVIKTRRQMTFQQGILPMGTIAKNIWKEEGIGGFFKGALPRTAKVAPACAIMVSSYEFCSRFISSRFPI